MPRKGTHYLVNPVTLPTRLHERNAPPPEKVNFKDRKRYVDPPENIHYAGPEPIVEKKLTVKDYYQTELSALEGNIAALQDRVAETIRDPDLRPADAKRVARKLGQCKKYLKSVKEGLMDFEVEAAQEQEAEAARQDGRAAAKQEGLEAVPPQEGNGGKE
ncbi:uncharacterized protein LOC133893187 [Phragmites australis]|uniref:uncharacterized protein LOC133893187 n=1 Tax=Phragmites australis TaxID=29695 RepID=UPI002D78B3B2|nr:uncharacterized protein LOC133893187 [Phragmites australis]